MDYDQVRVIFVIPNDCEDEKQTSTIMQDAYNSCKQNIIKTMWVHETNGEMVEKLRKTDFVVFQEFAGDLYEKTKNTRSARILGPWCLLSCLSENKEIPNVNWPLTNLAMEKCVVVCSNLQKQRKQELKFKIQAMGGYFTLTVVPQNTHLITDKVQSEKYNKAAPMGIKIMLPSWVDEVWEASRNDAVHADAERFSSHVCKVFQNLKICMTGFEDAAERESLERLIVQNGGKFSKRMILKETDILVCKSSASEKYKAAKKHKINCLTPNWIHDSVEKGYAIPDMQSYTVKKATSTPIKLTSQLDPNFSAISAIAGPLLTPTYSVLPTSIDSTTFAAVKSRDALTPKKRKSPHEIAELVEGLEIKKAKIAGPFLDGCSLYLCGFSSEQREKLTKVLNFSGAIHYDIPTDRVTHVVVGDPTSHDVKAMRDRAHSCHFVSVEWIVACMAERLTLPEDDYLVRFDGAGSDANGSPLIAKGLRLLRTNTSRLELADSCSQTEEIRALEDDILQQYLNAPDGEYSMEEGLAANKFDTRQCVTRNPDATSQPSISITTQEPKDPSVSQSIVETSEPSISITIDDNAVLRRKTFLLVDFDAGKEDEVRKQIANLGGIVVLKKYGKIPDYAVVPFNNTSTVPMATEIVNEAWIEDCYLNKAVPDEILYYHRPLAVERSEALSDAVVTLSGYAQSEKMYLRACCETAGAVVQSVLSRYTSDEKGVLKTTHLVSADSSGRKYNAAVKWGLAVVSKEWVLDCARRRERLPKTDYLVKGTDACTTPPLNTTNVVCSQIITPVNQIMRKAGIKFGDENETASAAPSTPKPWDYVATPDTPYGAFIVDPPPTELKKKFAKWINGFPDYKPRERRVSTNRTTSISSATSKLSLVESLVAFVVVLYLLTQAAASSCDYFVSFWTNLEEFRNVNVTEAEPYQNVVREADVLSTHTCVYIYGGLIVGLFILALLRSMLFYKLAMSSSQRLHDSMAEKDYQIQKQQSNQSEMEKKLADLEEKLKSSELKLQEELANIERENEEKVYVLLRQLRGIEINGQDEELKERCRIQLETNQKLQEQVEKLQNEVMELNNKITEIMQQMESKKSQKRKKKSSQNSYTEDENIIPDTLYHVANSSFEAEEDLLRDPDWRKTPLAKRVQRIRALSKICINRNENNITRQAEQDESTESLSEESHFKKPRKTGVRKLHLSSDVF